MSNRLLMGAGLMLILISALVLILQGISTDGTRHPNDSSIEIHATNAGIVLSPDYGRVYVYPTEHPGDLVTEAGLNTVVSLSPGQYDVWVLFSRSHDQQSLWFRNLNVIEGQKIIYNAEFSSGEINVEANVGGAAAEAGQVVVYLFKPQDHDQVITSVGSNEPALIAPGLYDVRVVWTVSFEEKEVRWFKDVQVKTGLQTKLKIHFQRGILNVNARNAGKALTIGSVELTVYRAGDLQEQELDTALAGEALGLPAGHYDIKAVFTATNDKPFRWLRDIEIKDNELLEPTVEFSSGTAVINAEMSSGELLNNFQVYVYYYRAGDHQQPITYTPAGEPVVLSAGHYDVRANFFRSHDRPDIWMRDVIIKPGGEFSHTLTFSSAKFLVRAFDKSGAELLGDNVFLYVFPTGQLNRPIVVARSGELLTLALGSYDIRAIDTRSGSREVWLRNVKLTANALKEMSVTF